jgi:hypothetical protein
MADLFAYDVANGTSITTNARKILGDGASGVGPYTSFGTPKLQALKIISASINFSTTPSAANSNLYKAVTALQTLSEIYYVGVPGNTATGFVALVHLNKTDAGNGYAASGSADGSYENVEDVIRAALGTAEDDVTVTDVTLSGLTFA